MIRRKIRRQQLRICPCVNESSLSRFPDIVRWSEASPATVQCLTTLTGSWPGTTVQVQYTEFESDMVRNILTVLWQHCGLQSQCISQNFRGLNF
jgi:hypothetical protein